MAKRGVGLARKPRGDPPFREMLRFPADTNQCGEDISELIAGN